MRLDDITSVSGIPDDVNNGYLRSQWLSLATCECMNDRVDLGEFSYYLKEKIRRTREEVV